MIAMATVLALIVAPLVEILTHGPAAHTAAASMAADFADAHGHTHGDAGHDHHDEPFAGHNPADHDHQLLALFCQAAGAPKPLPDKAQCVLRDDFQHLTREGPRRPPRAA